MKLNSVGSHVGLKFGLLAVFCSFSVYAQTITGKVVSIADGDTITVLDSTNTQHKVRFNGIDAPESSQPFGQTSKRNLSALIGGKTVTVEWSKTDRYGRLVATVTLDGNDINLQQLKAGLAWYYWQYERDIAPERRKPYQDAERAAKSAKRGLWSDPSPVAPWEFRHPDAKPGNSMPASPAVQPNSKIIGNRNSNIYHRPDCPDYSKVSERNRILFDSEQEAVKAGFRKAKNCP